MKDKKYYVTTAIVYASGKPHIGNVYDCVVADSIARMKRQQGYDVFFMTGTDEHGQKIEIKAKENNKTPKQFVDETASIVKLLYDQLNISYDRFIRTTDEDHEKAVSHIFQKLYDKGDIYKDEYEGWYCTPCESFFTDAQLVDGKCPDCGREVTKTKEEAYFFKMSKYADRLIKYFEENDFIKPESRKNEMINNFLKPGLKDLCVSRSSFTWGVPVPFDTKHIIYVWLDALINYITGIGYDPGNEKDTFFKYWPCDVHVIGKDIVRFHTIYWPIFLMALDLPLPKMVFGHPWLLSVSETSQTGSEKMSKSRGNVLYSDTLVDIFGVDGVRFYLLHEMPYENDGVVNLQLLCERYNTELANNLGNLVSRTIAMINKYDNGILVNKNVSLDQKDIDENLKSYVLSKLKEVVEKFDKYLIADSFSAVFDIFGRLNKYIDETEPWVLAKDENKKDRLTTVLYNLACGILLGSKILYSFMPDTSEKIQAMFNTDNIDVYDNPIYEVVKNNTKITDNKENLFVRKDIKDIEGLV